MRYTSEMRKSEINNGDSFSCRIQGVSVTGRVNTQYDNHIYLCNNKKDGHHAPSEMFGKDYAWAVPSVKGVLNFGKVSVTDFRITKTTKVVVKKANPASIAQAKTLYQLKEAQKAFKLLPTVDVDDEIIETKRKLAALESKKAAAKAAQTPSNYNGWNIRKVGTDTYHIGCLSGPNLTIVEMVAWMKITKILRERSIHYTQQIDEAIQVVTKLARLHKVNIT